MSRQHETTESQELVWRVKKPDAYVLSMHRHYAEHQLDLGDLPKLLRSAKEKALHKIAEELVVLQDMFDLHYDCRREIMTQLAVETVSNEEAIGSLVLYLDMGFMLIEQMERLDRLINPLLSETVLGSARDQQQYREAVMDLRGLQPMLREMIDRVALFHFFSYQLSDQEFQQLALAQKFHAHKIADIFLGVMNQFRSREKRYFKPAEFIDFADLCIHLLKKENTGNVADKLDFATLLSNSMLQHDDFSFSAEDFPLASTVAQMSNKFLKLSRAWNDAIVDASQNPNHKGHAKAMEFLELVENIDIGNVEEGHDGPGFWNILAEQWVYSSLVSQFFDFVNAINYFRELALSDSPFSQTYVRLADYLEDFHRRHPNFVAYGADLDALFSQNEVEPKVTAADIHRSL